MAAILTWSPSVFGLYTVGMLCSVGLGLWLWWALRNLPQAIQYAEASRSLEDVLHNLSAHRDDWSQARRDIEEAEQKSDLLETLRTDLAGLEAKQDTLNRVKEEISLAHGENAKMQAELSELRSDSARLEGLNSAESTRLEETKSQIEGLSEKRDQLAQATEALGVERAGVQATIKTLQEQLATLDTERKQLHDAIESLRPDHARLTSEVASLRQERTDAQARMEALQEQLQVFEDTYKGTIELLEKQWGESVAEWRDSQAQTREMVERQWEELKNHIENAVDIINGTWDRMKPPSAAESEEKYKDLWEPILLQDFEDAPPSAAPDEMGALSDLQEHLRESGLEYSERDVFAFHTCLKTNDISPLTVLAGISGTGKSLLPQRYAAGMGMHFLSIPVQPRWDSPQDLFGFYNYVEQRFKAEPLARALVQMDQFNDFPEQVTDLHGQMLLVLMDEMNLARVEYYFSEFLSKLETRRTVKPDKDSDRSAAEIAFEMGALREGETRYSTYPGSNVLFTGTMNEDETTQSLSDKVLDRANVLRFGRPRKLADLVSSAQMAENAEVALSHAHWDGWLRQPDEVDLRQVGEWIGELNEAMSGIQKPFGHRVNQAIQSYVANYPEQGETGTRMAFADQIEQRIIPKLRGLDTHDHGNTETLESIRAVIEKLDDRLLLKTFKASCNRDQFVWHGIDRSQES